MDKVTDGIGQLISKHIIINNCPGPCGARGFENVSEQIQQMNENPEERFSTNSGEFSRPSCQQKFV